MITGRYDGIFRESSPSLSSPHGRERSVPSPRNFQLHGNVTFSPLPSGSLTPSLLPDSCGREGPTLAFFDDASWHPKSRLDQTWVPRCQASPFHRSVRVHHITRRPETRGSARISNLFPRVAWIERRIASTLFAHN